MNADEFLRMLEPTNQGPAVPLKDQLEPHRKILITELLKHGKGPIDDINDREFSTSAIELIRVGGSMEYFAFPSELRLSYNQSPDASQVRNLLEALREMDELIFAYQSGEMDRVVHCGITLGRLVQEIFGRSN